MINNKRKIKFLTDKDEKEFLAKCTNITYKFAAVVMLDCGLRISELCTLKIKNFNFQKKQLHICSLKKGINNKTGIKKEEWRTVFLTDRVIKFAADYFVKLKYDNPESWIFPSPVTDSHIQRQQFWRYFDHVSEHRCYNHQFRHTFAVNNYESTKDIVVVSHLLGHASVSTTSLYMHSANEKRKRAMLQTQESRDGRLLSLAKNWFPEVFRVKNVHVLPAATGMTRFHVGRKQELSELHNLIEKRVNVLLIGEQGTGKSHILDNIQIEKILRIDDTRDFKKTLAAMCIQILDDAHATRENKALNTKNKQVEGFQTIKTKDELDDEARSADWDVYDYIPNNAKEILMEMLGAKRDVITSYSGKRLCELLIELTEKNEYTIIIDSADNVTPSVVSHLEFLRNHFHFVVAARKIRLEVGTWLTNFQRLKIEVLKRSEAIELIMRASEDFRQNIEDWELFKTHVLQKCGGNPQFTLELIDRFRKESFVSRKMISSIDYVNQGKKEISMTPFILLVLALGIVAKYWSRESSPVDYPAFAIFAAIAIVLAMFGRGLRLPMRRKYM